MSLQGVIVSYNETREQNIVTVASSGIMFSDRWVLAHGSMLALLKQAKDIDRLKNRPIVYEEFYNELPEIYVTCEANDDKPNYTKQLEVLSRHRHPEPILDDSSYQMRVLTGRICHIWKCPMLERCVNEVLYSWTIGHTNGSSDHQTHIGKSLLPVFVLIDLECGEKGLKTLRPLSELFDLVKPPPDRGSFLEVHSTPFGCEAFLNTVTKGTVCGVLGKAPCLLMTDAATALGSEGGPVFSTTKSLIGMVVCSVSWSHGEWVGLTLVVPLATVLSNKLRMTPPEKPIATNSYSTLREIIDLVDSTTVLVRCGSSWGSGVYIGRGHVITCAHVIAQHSINKVSVYNQGVKETAIVRYKSAENKAFDLALLYSNTENWPHLTPATFAKESSKKGEMVFAAGFPFFNENHFNDVRPIVSSGHISNVSPTMIQTSCCVQSGFSGGAIYRLCRSSHKIEVVGIIVSNTQTQDVKVRYPFINMAVPTQVFEKLIANYIVDKDNCKLKAIEHSKEIVQSQWKLMPYRSKI